MWEPFVYIWLYKPTGHWYIGSRTAFGCNQQDGYISSSEIVKEGVGIAPNDWERQIVATGQAQQMRDLEQQLLKDLNAKDDPLCLNQTNGNEGGIVLKSKPWKKRQKDTVLEDFYLKRLNNNVEERTTQGEHNE
jgi:hypothetical protein